VGRRFEASTEGWLGFRRGTRVRFERHGRSAAVNTAVALTLWNRTLRTLGATESSLINNTMLIQIALLAWLFLGESFGLRELGAFAMVVAGLLVAQLRGAAGARGG
jgi:drug/metabolite transporter (DMT)-like permease